MVRQKLFLFLPLILIFSNINAQSDLRIGVKGGMSIPNLKSSGNNPVSKGWSSRFGPYAGLLGELSFNERFALQMEINYSSQGGKKNGTQAIATAPFKDFFPPDTQIPPYVYAQFRSEVKLNYIELPVLIKVSFRLGENLSFFVNGGPYGGFLINAKNVTSGSSNIYSDENLTQPLLPESVSFDANTDIKSDLKKFNFGIQGGVGLNYEFAKNKLFLNAGGNYGLIPIQKDEANGKNNTGAATVTVGYLILLSKI